MAAGTKRGGSPHLGVCVPDEVLIWPEFPGMELFRCTLRMTNFANGTDYRPFPSCSQVRLQSRGAAQVPVDRGWSPTTLQRSTRQIDGRQAAPKRANTNGQPIRRRGIQQHHISFTMPCARKRRVQTRLCCTPADSSPRSTQARQFRANYQWLIYRHLGDLLVSRPLFQAAKGRLGSDRFTAITSRTPPPINSRPRGHLCHC